MADSVLQIIKDRDVIASVGTPQEITAALQDAKPGRYVVEESSMAAELRAERALKRCVKHLCKRDEKRVVHRNIAIHIGGYIVAVVLDPEGDVREEILFIVAPGDVARAV